MLMLKISHYVYTNFDLNCSLYVNYLFLWLQLLSSFQIKYPVQGFESADILWWLLSI